MLLKCRLWKIDNFHYRIVLGNDISDMIYRRKSPKWDPFECCWVDEENENKWVLSWDGISLDSFEEEEDVLYFLARFAYSIKDNYLVPSEILASIGLGYWTPETKSENWVDSWQTLKNNEKVVFRSFTAKRPKYRKILVDSPTVNYASQLKNPNRIGRRRRRKWRNLAEYIHPKVIEIPKLNFEELEKPRKRLHKVSRYWKDVSYIGYYAWASGKHQKADITPDEECVFTLKGGVEAEKAYKEQKKEFDGLQEE